MKHISYAGATYAPGKIVCVGRNYVEHIRELNNEIPEEPVLFIKPNSAIAEKLKLPAEKCRFEAEISLLVSGGAYVGVGFGLDLTLSEVQNRLKAKGLPWEKAKAFDGSAVFSPFVPCDNVSGLRLELWLNDQLQQTGGVELMIYRPEQLLTEIKRYFSLQDYDVIMTGTPQGVAELRAGDRLEGKIFNHDQLLTEQSWNVEKQ